MARIFAIIGIDSSDLYSSSPEINTIFLPFPGPSFPSNCKKVVPFWAETQEIEITASKITKYAGFLRDLLLMVF